ncbi:hypothetical protein SJAG_05310 [Schizosaccharomyces japonicus yFS275]|uniref:Uncharacterized protein n=1 Tax=Schizosaccharomyces japonicus (strain yFS275 / FY16936) TaxID=402676 RepID=B6K2V8_SCHJY|nr:hypothetical protein SJAG_05310 [Schizosaccharomyces japonicus yFS275]EEB08598.2 hypothetical protein SJAG_05310 [Schizosaccharomyces japonicus yFS275]
MKRPSTPVRRRLRSGRESTVLSKSVDIDEQRTPRPSDFQRTSSSPTIGRHRVQRQRRLFEISSSTPTSLNISTSVFRNTPHRPIRRASSGGGVLHTRALHRTSSPLPITVPTTAQTSLTRMASPTSASSKDIADISGQNDLDLIEQVHELQNRVATLEHENSLLSLQLTADKDEKDPLSSSQQDSSVYKEDYNYFKHKISELETSNVEKQTELESISRKLLDATEDSNEKQKLYCDSQKRIDDVAKQFEQNVQL